MPTISMFYGILVYMYFSDTGKHNMPHIHVEYQDYTAIYSIPEGDRVSGELPRRQSRMVEAWIELRQEELMADWKLAVNNKPVYPINPL